MPGRSEPPFELPADLESFLELYAAGRYWDSHEALEGAWRKTGSAFYQALILYASAWVHWERGNAHGVRAQLEKTLRRLADYPPTYLGFDVTALRAHCVQTVGELARAGGDWSARIRPRPLGTARDRVHGDEVELGAGGDFHGKNR